MDAKAQEAQMTQMQELLEQVRKEVKHGNEQNDKNFAKLGGDITEIKETINSQEIRIEEHEGRIKDLRKDVDEMAESLNFADTGGLEEVHKKLSAALDRIRELEKKEMESAVHTRKMNLLIYGIEGKEKDVRETENIVNKFVTEELKLEKEFQFVNTHRIPKRYQSFESPGPDPIVVKFLTMTDRDEFLRAATNISKESKIRVRTHLPRMLSKARAKLAREAYAMRQEGWMTRIREGGTVVWLERKKLKGPIKAPWSTVRSVSIDDILDGIFDEKIDTSG